MEEEESSSFGSKKKYYSPTINITQKGRSYQKEGSLFLFFCDEIKIISKRSNRKNEGELEKRWI